MTASHRPSASEKRDLSQFERQSEHKLINPAALTPLGEAEYENLAAISAAP